MMKNKKQDPRSIEYWIHKIKTEVNYVATQKNEIAMKELAEDMVQQIQLIGAEYRGDIEKEVYEKLSEDLKASNGEQFDNLIKFMQASNEVYNSKLSEINSNVITKNASLMAEAERSEKRALDALRNNEKESKIMKVGLVILIVLNIVSLMAIFNG